MGAESSLITSHEMITGRKTPLLEKKPRSVEIIQNTLELY